MWMEVLYWIDHVWYSKECMCCVCEMATHLAPWYVVLVCHQCDVCENSVGSVYIGGYSGLSESGLSVFRELCPVSFLVVDECPSVLL